MRKLLLAILLAPSLSQASDVVMATIDFPPVAIHGKDGRASGIGVDIVRELAKRAAIQVKESLVQVGQLPQISEKDVALIPMVARNPEREKIYRWVGKIMEDKYCFATKKGKPVIQTIKEAKAVTSIGVNHGGATEMVLKKNDVTNLDAALGNVGSIRKLHAGTINAWFSSEKVAFYSYKSEGLDPDEIVCSGDLGHPAYWIGASLAMSESEFEKIKAAFAALETDGTVKSIIDKYYKSSPSASH